jgi:dolichyl-phosphate-mannose-protein mannosyltransferase
MLPGATLGYDALQSVTHAARGIPTGLLSAFLHDPHPPLYYAVLALWLRLGSSDAAILLLSVLLSLLTVASVHRLARLRDGPRVAALAALVFAADPLALHWSVHARMYALVMLLSVWIWHLASRLAEGSRSPLHFVGAVAAELALLYSHVAAPFFLACILAAGVPDLVRHREARPRWLAAQAITALAALPYLFFPATTGQEHMKRPELGDVAQALALFTSGVDPAPAWLVPLGATAFAAVAACLLLRRRDRALAVGLLVLPFAIAALASHAIRPIWYAPRLFAFVTPFFALALARLLSGNPARLARPLSGNPARPPSSSRFGPAGAARRGIEGAVAAGALGLLTIGCITTVRTPLREERYVDAVALLREHGLPDDLVVVPTLKDKWALAWYAMGPEWSRGAVRADGLETLRRVTRGEERRALLAELARYGRDAAGEPFRIAPVDDLQAADLARAGRVWIAARSTAAADALQARLGSRTLESFEVRGLVVRILDSPWPASVDPRAGS